MSALNTPSTQDIAALKAIAGDGGWLMPGDGAAYLEEPRGRWKGQAAIILRPSDTAALAAIVRHCAAARLPIVPRGGGTGLVGGQVMPGGPPPVVLSTERLRAIRAVIPEEAAMTVEAGVPLAAAQEAAAAAGLVFPLSYASEGTATVGGALAVNSGGVRVIRYGNARALCLGLEVVTPQGAVWNGLSTLRKDNTGYDLKQLYIGSEGTLGIITAATLALSPSPPDVATAFAAVPSPDAAITLLRRAQAASGGGVETFELMPQLGITMLRRHVEGVAPPLGDVAPWYVLVEIGAPGAAAAMEAIFSAGFEDDLVVDAVLASSGAQRAALWRLRESLPGAQVPEGASIKHDISLPIGAIPAFLIDAAAVVEQVVPGARPCPFGHLGDGNLHYNITQPAEQPREAFMARSGAVNEAVHTLVAARGGSISAEHGIGRLKTDALRSFAGPQKMLALKAIKAALDPDSIMNPGAILTD